MYSVGLLRAIGGASCRDLAWTYRSVLRVTAYVGIGIIVLQIGSLFLLGTIFLLQPIHLPQRSPCRQILEHTLPQNGRQEGCG